jgi:FtsH-binding integral membrane protein
VSGPAAHGKADGPAEDDGRFTFDRHLVLEQLGGWRGMVDATLPTAAFIVANAIAGLTAGIWSAVVAAVLVFVLRLVRRQSVQQAVSGLFAVVVAVAIAAFSGHARDYFVLGIVRNAAIGVVLVGSALARWPLVGVLAEFLAPSHLGGMATHSLPLVRGRFGRRASAPAEPAGATVADRRPDPAPAQHWREDRRMLRSYTWLTLMWGATFLARVLVQGPLYQRNEVGLLGTTSLLLGLPLTAVVLVVTLWAVARLHRHRCPEPSGPAGPADEAPEDAGRRPAG